MKYGRPGGGYISAPAELECVVAYDPKDAKPPHITCRYNSNKKRAWSRAVLHVLDHNTHTGCHGGSRVRPARGRRAICTRPTSTKGRGRSYITRWALTKRSRSQTRERGMLRRLPSGGDVIPYRLRAPARGTRQVLRVVSSPLFLYIYRLQVAQHQQVQLQVQPPAPHAPPDDALRGPLAIPLTPHRARL